MKRQIKNPPKRKRYNRKNRLLNAGKWIANYNGKNIIKGYSKWFGVDLLSAIKELEILGKKIDENYKKRLIHSLKNGAEMNRMKSRKKLCENIDYYGDDLPF